MRKAPRLRGFSLETNSAATYSPGRREAFRAVSGGCSGRFAKPFSAAQCFGPFHPSVDILLTSPQGESPGVSRLSEGRRRSDPALAAGFAVRVPPISRRRPAVEGAQRFDLTTTPASICAQEPQLPGRNLARPVELQPGRIVGGSDLEFSHEGSIAGEWGGIPRLPLFDTLTPGEGAGVFAWPTEKPGFACALYTAPCLAFRCSQPQ
jgi:hypothetical protein